MHPCPFCQRITQGEVLLKNETAAALADGYPISPGHTLVVPTRCVASYFELTTTEQQALWTMVQDVRDQLTAQHRPDGFNVGINVGESAGQTVPHAHIHVIPRYRGDQPDPRGGVRWVLPEKAKYW